jgi:antitoxin (DNA-binding transcriptional repressor) of toxin-antitoxin stability system
MRRCALVCVLAVLTGCNQILGIDDPAAGPVDAAPPDATDFTCASGALETTASIDTTASPDSVTLSCGDTGSVDTALTFTAPATDYYQFSTAGSSFDTVLGLLSSCGGTELACNQNVSEQSSQSELVRKVERGEQVLVVVDGFAGARGAATVTAAAVTCPNQDLAGRTFPIPLNTTGQGNDVANACRPPGGLPPPESPGEDVAFHWIAPAAGLWAFRADADVFQPIIAVHRGPRCSDEWLGCNLGYQAEVVRRLDAGEEISIVVDSEQGSGGAFQLAITPRDVECPEADELVADFDEATTTTIIGTRTLAPSCGYTHLIDRGGGLHEMGDTTHFLTTPTNPSARAVSCSVQGVSSSPFILYALAGADCGGVETDCAASRPDSQDPALNEATISLSGKPDTEIPYTVVVAGNAIVSGTQTVTLTTSCFIAI